MRRCFILFWVIWNLTYMYWNSHVCVGGLVVSGRHTYYLHDACFCLPGYMEVVHIPKGSVHIEIREVTVSKNYIGTYEDVVVVWLFVLIITLLEAYEHNRPSGALTFPGTSITRLGFVCSEFGSSFHYTIKGTSSFKSNLIL